MDIDRFERERQRLLRLHEQVLGKAHSTAMHAHHKSVVGATEIAQSVIEELEDARRRLAEQDVRLAKLRQLEVDYRELKAHQTVLEETNERLMRHLLQMDDGLAERQELQQIVEMQRATIEKNRRHIHELEERVQAHAHNLGVLEKENEALRDRVADMQARMRSMLKLQEQQKQETQRLRAQLRRQEVALLQANESYEALREEYEAMYVNCRVGR